MINIVKPFFPMLVNRNGDQFATSARRWVNQYQEGVLSEENSFSVSQRLRLNKTQSKADPITILIELKAARESMEAEILDLQAKIESIKAQQVEIMKEFIG